MTPQHCFIGFEDLALTVPQRNVVVTALRALGLQTSDRPDWINTARFRLDNDAVILEAQFQDTEITLAAFKQQLATAFGVAVGTISSHTDATAYGPMITLTYAAVDRLRMILFGGASATWQDSRDACVAYLLANLDAWE